MTLTKVRLYQDVDGVLNAQMPFGWGKTQNGSAVAGGIRWKIRWAPAMVAELDALDVERVWATTWCDDAEHPEDGIVPLMGLTPGSRVMMPLTGEVTFPSIYWKFEALIADQEDSPSRFVWLDDEIDPDQREAVLDMGGFAADINPSLGITPKIMEQIRLYIDGADPRTL